MTATLTRTRRLTGFTPSGHLQLGNLFGAIRPIVEGAAGAESVAFLSDLHALTSEHDPAEVRANTLEQATVLLACGVDPRRTLFYQQSHVPEHAELHYLLECVTSYGEAHRMIQFKEKAASGQAHVRLSLLTYPVLMAADILLHDTEEVPVGEDQRQHVELTRDVAARFNARYGQTFVLPRAVNPPVAARIMDLSDPTSKMSKSARPAGTIFLLDPPEVVRRKVSRAVTDSETDVRYDPTARLGVSNLLEILAATAGGDPAELAGGFRTYGELKTAVADAVVVTLEPIQRRYAPLAAEPDEVRRLLAEGALRARETTSATVRRAKAAIGLS